MKKKNDKVIILAFIMLAIAILSWIVPQGAFNYGVFESIERVRAGIFDVFVDICMAFYSNITEILFILIVGGCYGVLSKANGYRKLVDKTAKLIEGKEKIALPITVILVSLFTSLSDQLLPFLIFVPFIITVYLRNGNDRLTAFAATFGGMIVGFFGNTVGMYAIDYLNESTGLAANSLIGMKIAIYIITLILFNVFAILHMNKTKKEDNSEYDLFLTEELDERKVKVSKRTKLWPIALIFSLLFIIMVLAHIDWENSFGVSFFTNLYAKFEKAFKVADVPVFSALLGKQMTAFGAWENLIALSFFVFAATSIVAIIEKMKFSDFVLRFEVGMKKVLRLAIIYGLVEAIYVMNVGFQWLPTIINKLLGSGSFSIPMLLLVSFIIAIFIVNPGYSNYIYGYYLTGAYTATNRLAESALLWHLGQGFAMIIAPTSILVLLGLTYLDIPYKKWLQYIWKFTLSLLVAVVIVMLVKVYM